MWLCLIKKLHLSVRLLRFGLLLYCLCQIWKPPDNRIHREHSHILIKSVSQSPPAVRHSNVPSFGAFHTPIIWRVFLSSNWDDTMNTNTQQIRTHPKIFQTSAHPLIVEVHSGVVTTWSRYSQRRSLLSHQILIEIHLYIKAHSRNLQEEQTGHILVYKACWDLPNEARSCSCCMKVWIRL